MIAYKKPDHFETLDILILIMKYDYRILLLGYTILMELKDDLCYSVRIAVLYSNKSSMISKFINIKFLAVKEKFRSDRVSIEHIRKNSMIMDPFTKELSFKVFHEHIAYMGVATFDDTVV